jgi:hypothetical protein
VVRRRTGGKSGGRSDGRAGLAAGLLAAAILTILGLADCSWETIPGSGNPGDPGSGTVQLGTTPEPEILAILDLGDCSWETTLRTINPGFHGSGRCRLGDYSGNQKSWRSWTWETTVKGFGLGRLFGVAGPLAGPYNH